MKTGLCWLAATVLFAPVCVGSRLETPALPDTAELPVQLDYTVVRTYPHDREAVTQGLVYSQGLLYESTGLFGASSLRMLELGTSEPLVVKRLESKYYGEGLTMFEDKLYQLTWRSGKGFIYKKNKLQQSGSFYYSGEGWGLTHNGHEFIMSDGSSYLQFLDPETMKPLRRLQVSDERGPVSRLNELEFIDGYIFANILYDSRIARIHPVTGKLTGWIELDELIELNKTGTDNMSVPAGLNGIAWDSIERRLFVTGKHWPNIFVIELVDQKDD